MSKILITFSLFIVIIGNMQADFTRKLVARWTFNSKGTVKVLTDDSGKYKLQNVWKDDKTKVDFVNGKLVMNGHALFTASAVNSKAMPDLTDGVTVWARIKITETPGRDCFFLGLLNSKYSADWKQQTLSLMFNAKRNMRLFGWSAKGQEFGNSSVYTYNPKDGFKEVAMVYDAKAGQFTVYVDGKATVRKVQPGALAAFQNLAVGRLKKHSSVSLEIDELRIYNTVVSPEWLGEIEPVE